MFEEEMQQALAQFSYGVYVVTSGHGEGVAAMTASWLCQVSSDPLLIAVAMRRGRDSAEVIEMGQAFGVNVLAAEQVDLAHRFAASRKFEGMSVSYFGVKGVPELPQVLAILECELEKIYEAGDHRLFLGRVISGRLGRPGIPLLMRDLEQDYAGH